LKVDGSGQLGWADDNSGLSLSNDANNRIVTGTGSGLNAEASLTFDGNQLFVTSGSASDPLLVNSTYTNRKAIIRETSDGNSNAGLTIQKKHSTLHPNGYWYGDIRFEGWDGDQYRRAALIECVAEGTPANDNMPGQLRIHTNPGQASQVERIRITKDGSVNIGGDYTQTTTKVKITGTTGLNGIQLSQSGSVTQNLKLKGLNTQNSNDVGISLYNNNNDWCCQLYGTNGGTPYYGFLDANWNSWDIRKLASGAFEVDEGSGLQRVLNVGNIGSGGALSNVTPYVNQLRIGANSTTASTAGDDLVIEGSSDRGLSIISGTGSSANIYFGDSSDADVGRIAYQHNDNALDFSVNARTTALRIDQGGVQNYTGNSADNRYANVQVRHKTPYSTDNNYPGATQTTTNQTVFSLYNESYGGNRMAFRSAQGHQFEIESKTRDLGSGSYNDADVYFRGQYDGALTDRYIIESVGAHTWKLRNGDTALNIDTSGRVTTALQPSFAAYKAQAGWTVNSHVEMVFDATRHNIGSHYSTSTGRFTAPRAGSYFFSFYTIYNTNVNSAYVRLYKNGGRLYGGDIHFTFDQSGHWHSVSFSQVLELSGNDYVSIYNGNSQIQYHGNNWQLFSGYLLG